MRTGRPASGADVKRGIAKTGPYIVQLAYLRSAKRAEQLPQTTCPQARNVFDKDIPGRPRERADLTADRPYPMFPTDLATPA